MGIAARRADHSVPTADRLSLQLGGAHRAVDEFARPVFVHVRQRTRLAHYARCRTGRGIMPVMQRSPVVIAATVVLASLAWALVLAFGSGPFAGSSAALLAGDLLVVGTVVAVGIVLSRGRWTRRAALVLLGGQAATGVVFEVDGWWMAAVMLSALAIGSVSGPWLARWLRRLPRADGPPPRAVSLSLGLMALPALVAVTAPEGVLAGGWVLSAFSLIAAWTYSQAWLPALWAVRVGLPVFGIVAGAGLPWIGILVLGLGVVILTALAWSPDVRRAAMTPTPAPVDLIPIPPELAPPEILEAAGLDDRGRPRRQGEK